MLAVRITKDGEPAQMNDFATAAVFPTWPRSSMRASRHTPASLPADAPSPVTPRPGILGGEKAPASRDEHVAPGCKRRRQRCCHVDGKDQGRDRHGRTTLARHALNRSTVSMMRRSPRCTPPPRDIATLPSCSRPSRGKRGHSSLSAAPRIAVRGQALAATRDGGENLCRNEGMVRVLTEQENEMSLAI
jgi:hypothetical protein